MSRRALPLDRQARLRRAALALLVAQGVVQVALAWDIHWHRSLGRDGFTIPPHLLFMASVGATGGLCLALVLLESRAHWRGRGDEGLPVLGLFRAPLGAVLSGVGALLTGGAATLDNLWWHALYGPDFVLWAPFHTMGLLGAILTALGILYLWGTSTPGRSPGADWGARLALATLLGHLIVLIEPATWQFPTADLGPLRGAAAPVLLALCVPWPLVGAARAGGARRPGIAVVGLLLARDTAFAALIPALTGLVAPLVGAGAPMPLPPFELLTLVADGLLLAVAALLDWLSARGVTHPLRLGLAAALPLWAGGAALTALAIRLTGGVVLPAGLSAAPTPQAGAILLALAPALLAGVLAARFGAECADIVRWNRR